MASTIRPTTAMRWGSLLPTSVAVFFMCLANDAQILAADDAQGLPPIECPLSKAGIDKTKLKPFEEVEDYIKFPLR